MRVVGLAATAASSLFCLAILSGCAADRESFADTSSLLAEPAPSSGLANPAPARSPNRSGAAAVLPVMNGKLTNTGRTLSANPARDDIRVMTFNLRCPVIFDGPNYWPFRKGVTLETIRKFNPDVLGTQECVEGQADYLKEQLSDYEFFGAGRNDGKTRGEMCALFFRKAMFQKLDGGHFWLSDSPEKPGSKSWGTGWPRMVTWVKLRRRSDGQVLCVFNTHFDVWGKRARLESSRLLRERMASIAGSLPTIVTGDFNDEPGSACYRGLLAGRSGSGDLPLTDTLRAANPAGDEREQGTRHDFWGGHGGPRIDWIMTSRAIQVVSAQVDHNRSGLRYPSDHFPMEAVVRVRGPALGAPLAKAE
jgi:endonuclease/exonuclease/phosphatase family metal-dependent hydrolase